MIKINLGSTLERLNKECKIALEEGSALSIANQDLEVTIEHFLLKILENPFSDIRKIVDTANINVGQLKETLLSQNNSEMNIGSVPSFSPMLIEIFQESWLISSLEMEQSHIRSGTIFLAVLVNMSRYLPLTTISVLKGINIENLRNNFLSIVKGSAEDAIVDSNANKNLLTADMDNPLEKYGSSFSQKAKNNEIDPVLSRDTEINLMIDVLCRRRKNNPIVVGDAGVGKSALIEGLALRIEEGKVPDKIKSVELWGLDLGALQSGASVKGEFEKRLKQVLDFVKLSPTPIILFIDEAHTLIGAGGDVGGSDAANLLKPALARGELKTIAATTWSEYKKYFEKDPALSRRFQIIKLNEPSVSESTNILRGLRAIYESDHGVYITDEALESASKLSGRYISGRKLPDKAIDILDTACARVAIGLNSPPKKITYLDNKILESNMEIDALTRDSKLGQKIDSKRLAGIKKDLKEFIKERKDLEINLKKQKKLVSNLIKSRKSVIDIELQILSLNKSTEKSDKEKIKSLKKEYDKLIKILKKSKKEVEVIKEEDCLISAEVNTFQVASVISDLTGIPINSITGDDLGKLTTLPDKVKSQIKGQDIAINKIYKNLLASAADLKKEELPIGVFLLVGPSGVGKTETAIQIAENLFGGKQFMTVINMSEYQEKHTVSKLIGSPPGYVGFGEGGLLTEAIRQKPYSIVLLDEVEKAHPDILNLFYQAFDKGEISDGEGRLIDCKNVLFFLTSNIGFDKDSDDLKQLDNNIMRKKLLDFFKPALLARMQIIQYNYLSSKVMEDIVHLKLDSLVSLFKKKYNADLKIDKTVINNLKKQCSQDANGARMLDSIINSELLPPLSLEVLKKIASGNKVAVGEIGYKDNNYEIKIK